MIQLTRIRTVPPVHANFHGKRRLDMNFTLMKMKRNGELVGASEKKWNSNFWKQAKDQLLAETSQKCAYCETPTAVVDYGDVEHFRPKSKYWWLAYCYDNYLASCAVCNQRFKSNEFPLRNEANKWRGPIIRANYSDALLIKMASILTVDPVIEADGIPYADFENELMSEWALLVHPYFEDPAEYYAYAPILETQEVHVVPSARKYKDVVDAADEYFGINRTELLNLRFQWYCLYMTFRHTLEDPNLLPNTRLMQETRLNDMRNGHQAYTGMIRYLDTQPLNSLPWRFDLPSSPTLLRPGS